MKGKRAYFTLVLSAALLGGCANQPIAKSQPTASPQPTVSSSAPSMPPSPRLDAATTWDSARHQLVVFGGFDATNNYLGDTWTWAGSWARKSVTGPSGRRFAAMVFDPVGGVATLHGGYVCQEGRGCQQLHDTWLWNGAAWLQARPRHTPGVSNGVMAYDPSSRSIVLFGFVTPDCPDVASTCPPSHAETWAWRSSDWIQLQVLDPTSPMQRLLGYQRVLSHDPTGGRMLLVGHVDAITPNTWAWDGSDWSLIGEVGPQSIQFNMYEDPARKTVVAEDKVATWSWDGTRWHQLAVSPRPGNVQEAGMAYDDRDHWVLLFGGAPDFEEPSGPKNSLWAWDGHAWTQLP